MFKFLKQHISAKLVILSVLFTAAFSSFFTFVLTQLSNDFLQGPNVIWLFLLFTGCLLMLQSLVGFLVTHNMVKRPLNKILRSVNQVRDGKMSEQCLVDSGDEFELLGKSFNEMMLSLNSINQSRKQIEERLIKAEESLKYKIALEEKAKIIERMNRELTGAFNDITLLFTVSQQLSSILEINELVATVRRIFSDRFVCDAFGLYFLNSKTSRLELATHKGLPVQKQEVLLGINSDEGLAGRVFKRQKSFYLPEINDEHRSLFCSLDENFTGSVFCVPLNLRDHSLGVLIVARSEEQAFSPTDRQSLESLAGQISVAHERSSLYTKTKELAIRDELTGAYNRRYFQDQFKLELKRAERSGRPVSLLMIDVDYFKQFNDTHGHVSGDELLRRLIRLISKNLREEDLLARYGGEEFVVLLSDTEQKDAILVGQKLCAVVKNQLKIDDLTGGENSKNFRSHVTVSIGVSCYPQSVVKGKDLIYTADMALYLAKKEGRDQVKSYPMDRLPLEEMMA